MTDQTPQSPDSPFKESISTSSERIELIIEAAERAAAGIIEDAEAQARSYLEDARRRADEIAERRAEALSGMADNLLNRAESVKEQSADLILALESARSQIAAHIADYGGETTSAAVSPPPPPVTPPAPTEALPPVEEPVETVDARPAISDDEVEAAIFHGEPEAEEPVADEPDADEAVVDQPAADEPDPDEAVQEDPVEDLAETPAAAASVPAPSRASAEPSAGARLLATQMAVAGSSRAEIADRLEHEFGIADPESMLDAILGPRT